MAGCLGRAGAPKGGADQPDVDSPADVSLPIRAPPIDRVDSDETLLEAVEDGGVSQDGIPSIDDPAFDDAQTADEQLDPDSIVFGLEVDGEARAYPQYILVWHEIVNDRIADQPVAVTYCPLTGTALCFDRGPVEFGVSGQLVNSNLIMYDRETESWWPQVLGTAIDGPLTGWSLYEHQLVWTSWERWRALHPDTLVLNEDADRLRSYRRDPYGSYNPPERYYAEDYTLFPTVRRDDRMHTKAVVLGFRTADGAAAVTPDRLRTERIIDLDLSGTPYLFVYDESLDTGFAYRNPDGTEFRQVGDRYARGQRSGYPPDSLPLDRVTTFDAMWFAWYAFYPESRVIE